MVNGPVYESDNNQGNSLLYTNNFGLCWSEPIIDNV
jgi:hypothetical protein